MEINNTKQNNGFIYAIPIYGFYKYCKDMLNETNSFNIDDRASLEAAGGIFTMYHLTTLLVSTALIYQGLENILK